MEEDIKILERYLEKIDRSKASFNRFRFLKAIENLIKGYRELEEQIDKHVYFETTNPKEIEKNYIPKSKIKEKIKEYKKKIEEKPYDKPIIEIYIRVLQELMEDK